MSYAKDLVCLKCGAILALSPVFTGCPHCCTDSFRSNLTVRYDYSGLRAKIDRETFGGTKPGVWRYADLLPVSDPGHHISLHEGGTPLIPLHRVAREAGLENVFAKDETRNPTWSYKDRFCAVATSKALEFGAKATTTSSSGNQGASAAAYAARAGLPCYVFTLSYTSANMLTNIGVYGAIVAATEKPQDRWKLMAEGIRRYGWCPIGSYTLPPTGNPYGVEGYKSLSFEIAEQLDWRIPDYVVVPTAYSEGLYGCWKGFSELRELDLVESAPKMIAAAPEGCDPLRVAWEQNLETIPLLEAAKTIAISIGASTTGYQGLVALRESQGQAVSVSDSEIIAAQRLLALDGIWAESSSAASVAAVIKRGRAGAIEQRARVVCVLTSSGLKVPEDTSHYLPAPPVVEPDFDSYRQAVEAAYQIKLA